MEKAVSPYSCQLHVPAVLPGASLRSLHPVPQRIGSIFMCAVFVLMAVSCSDRPRSAGRGGTITLDAGQITGVMQSGVESFKGIRYAQPPLGALRWRPPQPVQPWRGILAANAYGKSCAQQPFPGDAAPLAVESSEDCLFLNVWRLQRREGSQLLPVMVWIHGGGFVNGSASSAVYDGTGLAQKGVLVVSINYRLGRFGFFAHPALTRALAGEKASDRLLGNYGLMDQIAALRWVQKNVRAFGGDPANVTVFGESAGGFSIISLLTTPLASGLFSKAIVESGGGRSNLAPGLTLARAEEMGAAFASTKHIDGRGAEALAALRQLPADQLVDGLNMATMARSTFSGPMIDGKLILGEPQAIYASGAFNRVRMIVGANNADLGMPPPIKGADANAMSLAVAPFGPANRAAAVRAYNPDGTSTPQTVAMRVTSDRLMVEPARFVAQTFSERGIPVWEYRFGYVADALKATMKGAAHATEVPYVFGTLAVRYGATMPLTPRDLKVAELMQDYWVNFAKSGEPNGSGLPLWNRYSSPRDNLLFVAPAGVTDTKEIADPWKARLELVRALYAAR